MGMVEAIDTGAHPIVTDTRGRREDFGGGESFVHAVVVSNHQKKNHGMSFLYRCDSALRGTSEPAYR